MEGSELVGEAEQLKDVNDKLASMQRALLNRESVDGVLGIDDLVLDGEREELEMQANELRLVMRRKKEAISGVPEQMSPELANDRSGRISGSAPTSPKGACSPADTSDEHSSEFTFRSALGINTDLSQYMCDQDTEATGDETWRSIEDEAQMLFLHAALSPTSDVGDEDKMDEIVWVEATPPSPDSQAERISKAKLAGHWGLSPRSKEGSPATSSKSARHDNHKEAAVLKADIAAAGTKAKERGAELAEVQRMMLRAGTSKELEVLRML